MASVIRPAVAEGGALPPWLRRWHLVLIDVMTGVVINVLTVYSTFGAAVGRSSTVTLLVWLVAVALSIPLPFRRRWPIPVFAVVVTAAILGVLLNVSAAAMLAVALAIYPVAFSVAALRSAVVLGSTLLGVTLATLLSATVVAPRFPLVTATAEVFETDPLSSLGFSYIVVGTGWMLGRSFRARREYAVQLADRRSQQAVAEERLRIAREMHDVVAHSMSVIVMKAAVANHVYDTRPEEGREALGIIELIGRGALADIRRVLESLRSESEVELTPNASLDDVPKLIENARHADVHVELDYGPIPALPSGVQLSAYRILQEALTNVIKHVTTPARCTVRIAADSRELHLTVIDDGTPCRPLGLPGHGLIGMRERAALHHGTLEAGRAPGGGFAVHARLPYYVGSERG